MAVIGKEGESTDAFRPGADDDNSAPAETPAPSPEIQDEAAVQNTPSLSSDEKIHVSPRAKKMAGMHGITLQGLTGSGPYGRIIVRDVEAAMQRSQEPVQQQVAQPVTPASPPVFTAAPANMQAGIDYTDQGLSNVRKLIAKAMHASLQNTAQLTHHLSADARRILSLRKEVKKLQQSGYAHNITLNDMISYAAIRALLKNPDANVHFFGDSIRKFHHVHLGMAVDTERGLMVPSLQHADQLSLPGLSSRLKDLANRCRIGSIDPDLLASTAGTFTISNLGNYGVEMFTPILNIPQAAILGVNTIVYRPAPQADETMAIVPFIGLSLTYDHRALDGGPATKLLADIKQEIENLHPELIHQ